jgi:hypothetical protein
LIVGGVEETEIVAWVVNDCGGLLKSMTAPYPVEATTRS